jgi:hypothetical protein
MEHNFKIMLKTLISKCTHIAKNPCDEKKKRTDKETMTLSCADGSTPGDPSNSDEENKELGVWYQGLNSVHSIRLLGTNYLANCMLLFNSMRQLLKSSFF